MRRDEQGKLAHTGVYVGDDWETYSMAARASREQNITVFDEPVEKIVAVMQADEFRATWVANKAIYRTRMALADGGDERGLEHDARRRARLLHRHAVGRPLVHPRQTRKPVLIQSSWNHHKKQSRIAILSFHFG